MSEPELYDFEISVCVECLKSRGSECHTPGCAFWMHDVPTSDTARALRAAVKLTVATRCPHCDCPVVL